MVDDNSTTERVEASEGGQLHSNLILRLERKISQLEEEVASMRDLAKLSISLGTQFGENIDNPPNQTATPDNPPIHISPPEPTRPNAFPPPHAQNTQFPFHHYYQHTKPTVPEITPNTNIPYTFGNNNPIYVEIAPLTHDLHESESHQKDILIKTLIERLDNLTNRVQHVEGNKKLGGLGYEDLCMHPDVELPEEYKLPKFETFNGIGDPNAHLRMYCDKLVGVGRDERILMKLFMRSLTGEALSWYIEQDSRKWIKWVDMATDFMNRFGFNIENAPDWFYIQNLKKKPSESFREYAIRWRSEAARARPPMEESQMKDYFIRAQEPQYYDRMMLVAEKSFAEIIKLGERIEEGIKNGTIINLEALQATNKALQSGGMIESRKKTGSAGYVSPIPALPVDVRAKWYDPNKVCAYHSGMKGHTTEVCRALKDKVQMLIDTKTIQLKDPTPNVANNPLPNHQVNMVEAGGVWDWVESIWAVETEEAMPTTAQAPLIVQGLTPFEVEVAAPRPPFAVYKASAPIQCDTHAVPWDYNKRETNVEETDVATGVTRSGRIYTSENLVQGSSSKSKAPVIELEDQSIWKKVKAKEYSVIEQLSKTPSQISILELLQSSELIEMPF
ncbi:uncharacterized protein [Solanum lycopersicum]|uniref:uncharacterized protein n=1 Tax=Solanum lycopersicum TaxID=4081 RepID=UPI003748DD0B